jgi:23S rRNA (cytosine1962-C5)-methyltransferase
MFRNRLMKVFRHVSRQAKRLGVGCYRIYDHDLPEFPLCIEIYEDKLYVAEYRRRHGMEDKEHEKWMSECVQEISEVLNIPRENIFIKLRQKKTSRAGQYQKLDETRNEFIVHENGLKFIVNLDDYLDTGLFLDHRITREKLRAEAAGKKVLNLFSYTGSFSVYAAAGGADEVVSVDLSKTYLQWSERNFKLNEMDSADKYKFIHADVKQYLETLPPDYFDLIVMDPPTFSNSKRMDDFLDIQKDHVALINNCLLAMKQGGELYFSTNYRKFQMDEKNINASSIRDITKATTPFDFEGKLGRVCYLMVK